MNRYLLASIRAVHATLATAGPLAIDSNSLDGIWHSSVQLKAYLDYPTNTVSSSLRGNVDWVVYAPGHFPSGLAGYEPAAAEYVYAYQLILDDESTEPLRHFEVTLETIAHNVGTYTGDNEFGEIEGVQPTSSYLQLPPSTQSLAAWDFELPFSNGRSSGLAFTSRYRPQLLSGAFYAEIGSSKWAVGDVVPMPTPTPPLPEPSSLVLGLFAVAGLTAVAVRKRPGGKEDLPCDV